LTQVIQIHVYTQTVETAHTKYIYIYVCYDKYHFSQNVQPSESPVAMTSSLIKLCFIK